MRQQLNTNAIIFFKLTLQGALELNKKRILKNQVLYAPDQEVTMRLWEFMEEFGPHTCWSGSTPYFFESLEFDESSIK